MTTHHITEKYLIARSAGRELGNQLSDGDTLDLRKCIVVTTDFIGGLSDTTTDKRISIQLSAPIIADTFETAKRLWSGWAIGRLLRKVKEVE